MVPRLVPEISSLDAFCDGGGGAAAAGAAARIGDSRSLIMKKIDITLDDDHVWMRKAGQLWCPDWITYSCALLSSRPYW